MLAPDQDAFQAGDCSIPSLATGLTVTVRENGKASYYRARYYDMTSGRFISEDPIGFKGGDNLYAFVKNNPLLLRDPKGTCPGPLPCTPPPVFDTVSAHLYTCPCQALGDIDKTCQCLALPYSSDTSPGSVFMKQCKGCYGAQKSPRDACQCACTLIGNDKARCDLMCNSLPKKWPK